MLLIQGLSKLIFVHHCVCVNDLRQSFPKPRRNHFIVRNKIQSTTLKSLQFDSVQRNHMKSIQMIRIGSNVYEVFTDWLKMIVNDK